MNNFYVMGLCAVCRHTKIIKSARGSRFTMCNLAKTDPRFEKYPVLPVLACAGFQQIQPPEDKSPSAAP